MVTPRFIDFNGMGFMRGTGGWSLFTYLFLTIYGYLFFCNSEILETIKKYHTIALLLAVSISAIGLIVRFGIKPNISEDTPILYLTITLLKCLAMLCWLVAIVGFGEKYLNFTNGFLKYASEALLPFYILHQTIILIIGFFVVQWDTVSFVKFLVISTCSFGVIMILYETFIKRFALSRFLFGLKPTK